MEKVESLLHRGEVVEVNKEGIERDECVGNGGNMEKVKSVRIVESAQSGRNVGGLEILETVGNGVDDRSVGIVEEAVSGDDLGIVGIVGRDKTTTSTDDFGVRREEHVGGDDGVERWIHQVVKELVNVVIDQGEQVGEREKLKKAPNVGTKMSVGFAEKVKSGENLGCVKILGSDKTTRSTPHHKAFKAGLGSEESLGGEESVVREEGVGDDIGFIREKHAGGTSKKVFLTPKHSGDYIKVAVICSNCPKKFNYLSSLKRHLISVHKVESHFAQEQVDILRKDGGRFDHLKTCPVTFCNAKFRIVNSYTNHLINNHNFGVTEAKDMSTKDEFEKHLPDRWKVQRRCPKQECVELDHMFSRKCHFFKHLQTKHNLDKNECLKTLKEMLKSEEQDIISRMDVCSVERGNLKDKYSGNSVQDSNTEVAYEVIDNNNLNKSSDRFDDTVLMEDYISHDKSMGEEVTFTLTQEQTSEMCHTESGGNLPRAGPSKVEDVESSVEKNLQQIVESIKRRVYDDDSSDTDDNDVSNIDLAEKIDDSEKSDTSDGELRVLKKSYSEVESCKSVSYMGIRREWSDNLSTTCDSSGESDKNDYKGEGAYTGKIDTSVVDFCETMMELDSTSDLEWGELPTSQFETEAYKDIRIRGKRREQSIGEGEIGQQSMGSTIVGKQGESMGVSLFGSKEATKTGRKGVDRKQGIREVEGAEHSEEREYIGCSLRNGREEGDKRVPYDKADEMEKKKRKAHSSVAIGEKIPCPNDCGKMFATSYGASKHLNNHCKINVDDKEKQMEKIKSIKKECVQCGKWFSNVWKHKPSCKGTLNISENEVNVPLNLSDVPKGYESGGRLFLQHWAEFMAGQTLAEGTKCDYTRKLKRMIPFFEQKVKGLKMDMLLYPLENNMSWIPLQPWLSKATTLGDVKMAIQTYLYMVTMIHEVVLTRYSADSNQSTEKKASFLIILSNENRRYSKMLKGINNQIEIQGVENAADRQDDPEDLTYNPDKLRDVVEIILKKNFFSDFKDKILNMTVEEIAENCDEVEVRSYILAMLMVFGNGQRAHAACNMTIAEFQNASKVTREVIVGGDVVNETIVVAKVKKHKLAKLRGRAPVAFLINGLWDLTSMYMNAFRDPTNGNGFLFATMRGKTKKPMEVGKVSDWLKKHLKDDLTEQQLKTLTSKSWRKGWTNWGLNHPDPVIHEMSDRVMFHSKRVQQSNYAIMNVKNAAEFGSILEKKGKLSMSAPIQDTVSDYSSESDDEEKSRKGKQRSDYVKGPKKGRYFTERERRLLRTVFTKNGILQSKITNKSIDRAIKENLCFGELYDRLVEEKGRRKEANNTIRKCLLKKQPKEKKQ